MKNYGDIKNAIRAWLYDRNDLAPMIPVWVELAERRIFRNLRCPANETTTTIDNSTRDYLTVPYDLLEVKVIKSNDYLLERISDQAMITLRRTDSAPGLTRKFSRYGDRFLLWRLPDTPQTIDMVYWHDKSGQLDLDSDTNDIIRIAPDLYLYGALIEASPYLGEDNRMPVWSSKYEDAIARINQQADEAEYAGSTVQVSGVYGGV